ncbi:hypothetical protein [Methylobacterium isbiliense]|uniref:hypothetical protein n=1 Tax=Methylobacterium isbiliense TaxID=315478 RepID=UPI001EE38CD7|nr:hypothetical protein [Methylobacterium isbiliense]MDN3625787.1 hypothetical protein [Methylobacterium isbiliense]
MTITPPTMTTQFDRMISLGVDCRVRYQISRRLYESSRSNPNDFAFHTDLFSQQAVTQPHGAFFFDWLVTPMTAVLETGRTRFADCFDYESLKVATPSIVEHKRLGIKYVHNFHDLIIDQPLDIEEYKMQSSKI